MRAARAAPLFFLVQPIRFLIYDVNIVVDVVDAEAHKYPVCCNFLRNVILLYYNLYHLTYEMRDSIFKHSLNNSH